MADLRAVVPDHDPHDSPYSSEYIHNLFDIFSPTPPPSLLYDIDNVDPNHTFDAQIIFDDHNTYNNLNLPEDSNTSTLNIFSNNLHADNNKRVLPFSALSPQTHQEDVRSEYNCSFCHVLREIVHVNEMTNFITKLEVHGRVGFISHAVLDEHVNVSGATHQYQMFEVILSFCKKSLEDVKLFLIDYFNKRKQAGFRTLLDPLSFYYEVLCVGLDFTDFITFGQDFLQPSPIRASEGAKEMNQAQVENQMTDNFFKSSLSVQRERTGKLTIQDLESYFHLPIEEAGRLLNLCPTVIKKVCRRHNLHRWPYRKIKSLNRQIMKWSENLRSDVQEDKVRAEAEIHKLQQELGNIYHPLS